MIAINGSFTKKFLIIFFIPLIVYCQKSKVEKPIEENKFVDIYTEVITYADLVKPNLREAFVDSVLKEFDVSREQFESAILFYSQDNKTWEKIFNLVLEELEKREQAFSTSDSSEVNDEKTNLK